MGSATHISIVIHIYVKVIEEKKPWIWEGIDEGMEEEEEGEGGMVKLVNIVNIHKF